MYINIIYYIYIYKCIYKHYTKLKIISKILMCESFCNSKNENKLTNEK